MSFDTRLYALRVGPSVGIDDMISCVGVGGASRLPVSKCAAEEGSVEVDSVAFHHSDVEEDDDDADGCACGCE